jgi:hypothetical protein
LSLFGDLFCREFACLLGNIRRVCFACLQSGSRRLVLRLERSVLDAQSRRAFADTLNRIL